MKTLTKLEGFKAVIIKEGLIFAWNGGHGVDIYNFNGDILNHYNTGDFSKDSITFKEFKESISYYLAQEGSCN